MRFELSGTVKFSGNVEGAKADIEKALAALVAEVDSKKKGTESVSFRLTALKDDSLELFLDTRLVRAHELFLRMGKRLGEVLAERKIGVRSLRVGTYRMTFELEKAPLSPISIPFASELHVENGVCTMVLKDLDEEFLRKNYVDRMMRLVSEKASAQHYEGKGEHWELLWQSQQKRMAWDKDPTEEMLKAGWLKQGPTKGRWFFNPQAAKVMRAMEAVAEDEILRKLGFQEVIESHDESFDVLIKTGHLEGTPMERYYIVSPRSRDPKDWERFMDLVKITRKVPTEELAGLLSPPDASLCYAQCPVIYWSLSGATIANDSLPLLLYDKASNSNRYESGGRHGIERVD